MLGANDVTSALTTVICVYVNEFGPGLAEMLIREQLTGK